MSIAQNLEDINKKLAAAAEKSGRKREDILLLAVSKTIDVPRIKEAVALGCTQLGENRVQEIMEKYDEIPGVEWHLIGHLQTNKVKYIADKVKLIHSVDSLKLGNEISLRCSKADRASCRTRVSTGSLVGKGIPRAISICFMHILKTVGKSNPSSSHSSLTSCFSSLSTRNWINVCSDIACSIHIIVCVLHGFSIASSNSFVN